MPNVYLYGFIDTLESPKVRQFRTRGLGGAPATVIDEDGVGALVGSVSHVPVPVQPDLLLAHENVLERALGLSTVLPAAFGTVAGTRAEIRGLLGRHREVLRQEFERLRGLCEFGLKVYWRREIVRRELSIVSETEAELGANDLADPDYVKGRAIRVGQEVEALILYWRRRYEDAVFAGLRARASDMRLGDPIGPRMMWNASFLIARSDTASFEDLVERTKTRFGDRFTFRMMGPLPPYNFVSLHLR
jgi:hypothetical protein